MPPRSPFHKANKNPVGQWAVSRLLIAPAMRRAFGGVYAFAEPAALALRDMPDLPVVVCSTHPGWWDGYMAALVNRRVFGRDGYLMMEEDNLARYFFFTWAGVFGVSRDDPRKALASVDYAACLLAERPNRLVWMFPQGIVTHPDCRPLKLYSGAARIARKAHRCAVVPVAIRYDFMGEQAPGAFARAGSPILVDGAPGQLPPGRITARLEQDLAAVDDTLRGDLLAGNMGHYRRILAARGSVSRVWDGALDIFNGLARAGAKR